MRDFLKVGSLLSVLIMFSGVVTTDEGWVPVVVC